MEEKRIQIRVAPASLTIALCADRVARVKNMSGAGVCLEGISPVAVGSRIDCKLWLSSFESHQISGVVRWQKPDMGFAIEFQDLENRVHERIMLYCSAPQASEV